MNLTNNLPPHYSMPYGDNDSPDPGGCFLIIVIVVVVLIYIFYNPA